MSAYLKLVALITVVAIIPLVAIFLLVPASNHAAWHAIDLFSAIAGVISVGLLLANRFSRIKARKGVGQNPAQRR